MTVDGSVCVVTGAGRGLGLSIAQELAAAGARVYGCDVALPAGPPPAGYRLLPCDVSDEASVEIFFAQVIREAGRLDALVNNAGITRDALLAKRPSVADFRKVIDVNLVGVFLCAREAVGLMSRQGVIVNVSSVSRAGNFGQSAYSAAKAGVAAMTVTWAKELAPRGIRVAAVAPGYLDTEMVAGVKPEAMERILAQVPLKRLGRPEEIARAVRFILENDFLTGRVLEIDGGLRV